jgi:hypothetical protein
MRLIFLIIGIIFSSNVFSQDNFDKKNEIKYGLIIDTIDIHKFSREIKSLWKNDTIIIRRYYEPTVDTNYFRLLYKDKSYIPNLEDIKKHNDFLVTVAQNCFSYALEMYFRSNCLLNIDLFNNETYINSDSFKKILNSSFELIQEFNVIKKRKLYPKEQLKDSSLIVFSNHYDMIIHSVYYENNIFYTKNGGLKPVITEKISDLFKLYWDTKNINVYIWKEKK